jgi:hypothetical protein
MKKFKCTNYAKHFVFKNENNFKSHKNMITTLNISFLYHKPWLCSYVIHIMTHLHLANDFWNLNILKLYFEFLKISSITILKLECFSCVNGRLSPFQKNSHHNLFIKRILSLVFYKTNFGVLKFKSPLLKLNLNLLN